MKQTMITVDPIIALIDDDPPSLKSVGRVLVAHGFRTDLYSSGEEFLNSPQALNAAMIVTDFDLGAGLSGLELARAAADMGLRVPLVLMSGIDRAISTADLEHLGIVTFLVKPFSIEVLIEIIRTSLSVAERRRPPP